MLQLNNLYVYDCEVFAYDYIFVFKNAETGEYTIIHNSSEELTEFMSYRPLLVGYNNKNYDQFILRACLMDMLPEEVKGINDLLIKHEVTGWEIPELQDSKFFFNQFDLMDDTQQGTGLKDIEGHLGMNIQESTVSFDIKRPLTEDELEEVIEYCKHDVDATHILFKLREVYIANKLKLGQEKEIPPEKALYMTNAKLTAAYLDASTKKHTDEREYVFPDNILWEYIPAEVKAFYEQIHDKSIPGEDLFSRKLDIMVGECSTRLGYGGIHGAILNYEEEGD